MWGVGGRGAALAAESKEAAMSAWSAPSRPLRCPAQAVVWLLLRGQWPGLRRHWSSVFSEGADCPSSFRPTPACQLCPQGCSSEVSAGRG